MVVDMKSGFYSYDELNEIGLKSFGENVMISRKCSIYGAKNITIGNNVRIDDFCILSGFISIGDYVHISAYSVLYGKFGIKIGNFCGISPRSTLLSATDDFSGEYMISPLVKEEHINLSSGTVTLENFTQIGANSIVMPKITLFEGSICGAFSFVNKDLEKWSMYKGIPVKKFKERKNNIKKLAQMNYLKRVN